MSLNAHDRQALELIEEGIADTDPQLAARLSAFARLADGAMPDRERIEKHWQPAPGQGICSLPAHRSGTYRLMCVLAVVMALSIALALITIALVSAHTGGSVR